MLKIRKKIFESVRIYKLLIKKHKLTVTKKRVIKKIIRIQNKFMMTLNDVLLETFRK